MKPVGPIPVDFAGPSRLMVGGVDFAELLERAGDTPAFLYDGRAMAARVARLRAALPEAVRVHYAIKANPHRDVLVAMAGMVDGLDVASGGELAMALAVKVAPTAAPKRQQGTFAISRPSARASRVVAPGARCSWAGPLDGTWS